MEFLLHYKELILRRDSSIYILYRAYPDYIPQKFKYIFIYLKNAPIQDANSALYSSMPASVNSQCN